MSNDQNLPETSAPGQASSRYEETLVALLRVSAVLLLTAAIPAVMPFSWMNAVHQYLGMGELPQGPIMGYLTRSLSAMYVLHGGLVLFISLDVRRHLAVVKCLAVLLIIFGTGMIVLDVMVGMPWFWILSEGPLIVLFSIIVFWLARRIDEPGFLT
jgi:hypothetical protein